MMKHRPALIAAVVIAAGICTAKSIAVRWEIFAVPALLFFLFSAIELWNNRRQQGRDFLYSFSFLTALFFSSAASFAVHVQLRNDNHL